MKFWKKLIAGGLALTMVSLAACSGGSEGTSQSNGQSEGNETQGESTGSAGGEGRYLEEELNLPENVDSITTFRQLEDGTIRLLTPMGIYDSTDGGNNWEMTDLAEEIMLAMMMGESYLTAGAIDKEGNLFLSLYEGDQYKHYYVENSGEMRALDIVLDELDSSLLGGMTYSFDDEDLEEGVTISGGPDNQETDGGGGADETANPDETNMDNESPEQSDGDDDALFETNGFLNTIQSSGFAENGNILIVDYMGKIYQIDKTDGSTVLTYSGGDSFSLDVNFLNLGDKLICAGDEGVDIYDFNSGDYLETDEVLNNYFKENKEEASSYSYSGESTSNMLTAGQQEDEIYFADATGLYRYVFGTSAVEMVINGALNTMADPGSELQTLNACKDGTFLANYVDTNGSPAKLMRYEYSAEASAVPSKELKIYALYDNQTIRQAVANFQKNNTDYYVNFEAGLTGTDATTVSDALRTLNTNIMAGNGPDVMILDGMPVDSYIEKGMLYDLSELTERLKGQNTYFENIFDRNKSEDGNYAIPTRFMIPTISADSESLEKISSLNDLVDAVETFSGSLEEGKTVVGNIDSKTLLQKVYSAASASFISEDGSLDEDRLTEFLTNMTKIYENNGAEISAEILMSGRDVDSMSDLTTALAKKQNIRLTTVTSFMDFGMLLSVNDKAEWNYDLQPAASGQIYLPMDIVGINAKSDNIDAAADFIELLLSKDIQKLTLADGFPVNADSFDELCEEALEDSEDSAVTGVMSFTGDDEEDELNMDTFIIIRNGTEEEYSRLKEQIQSLNTPADTDEIIMDAVISEGEKCVRGDSSVADAVASILSTVSIYMAE